MRERPRERESTHTIVCGGVADVDKFGPYTLSEKSALFVSLQNVLL
jgi:hypothetical protein